MHFKLVIYLVTHKSLKTYDVLSNMHDILTGTKLHIKTLFGQEP